MDRENRVRKLLSIIGEKDLDSILISSPENRFYLSGFKADDISLGESSGYLLITSEKLFLLTDFRYVEAAKEEAPSFDIIVYDNRGCEETIAQLCRDLNIKTLAVESIYISVKTFKQIEKALLQKGCPTEIVATQNIVEALRAKKTDEEILKIRESLQLSERVIEETFHFIKPEAKEKEIAWFIEKRLRESGAETVSFPPIVAGGPRSALPHAEPTDRPILPGTPIVIDMGARLNAYCSDITRTVFLNTITSEWKKIYEIVLEAQRLAQEAARPGILSSELDGVARSFIEEQGYGDCFGHGLGHGVGLAVHELPAIRKLNPVVLEENMIFTIEPGIYIPGKGGIRLENMVLLKHDGAEVLNKLPCFPSVS